MQADPNNPNDVVAIGDPTEAALLVAALQFGVEKNALEQVLPRVGEVSFSSERKRMTTVHRIPFDLSLLPVGGTFRNEWRHSGLRGVHKGERRRRSFHSATKPGSTESSKHCRKAEPKNSWLQTTQLAANGMRILGVAFRFLDSLPEDRGRRRRRERTCLSRNDGHRRPAKNRSSRCSFRLQGSGNSARHDNGRSSSDGAVHRRRAWNHEDGAVCYGTGNRPVDLRRPTASVGECAAVCESLPGTQT